MPLFTAENAAEMAKRSHIARAQPKPAETDPIPLANDAPLDAAADYVQQKLVRVREQVDIVLKMLKSEKDAQKIDRLASALARLNEIERQLANRPLPGSWKPERPAQTARRMPRVVAQPLQVQPNPPNSPENTG